MPRRLLSPFSLVLVGRAVVDGQQLDERGDGALLSEQLAAGRTARQVGHTPRSLLSPLRPEPGPYSLFLQLNFENLS